MKLVCGSDLSKYSEPALRAAIALAMRLPVDELWCVHIVDAATLSLGLPDVRTDAMRSIKAQLAEIGVPGTVKAHCDTLVATRAADSKSVDQALLRFAKAHGASLLVVASQGQSASPLARLGGTSERLANASELPVLVVRDAAPFEAWARKERPLRVLLGTDGRGRSRPALELCQQLRAAGDCELVIGHVYDTNESARDYGLIPQGSWLTPDPHLEALIARDLEREFDPSEQSPRGVRFQPVLGIGRSGDHLLDLAERETIDLIVVGSHPMPWFDRLSSVSSVVLHFGHASVACVPTALSHAPREIPRIKRVLAATDFSELGNAAIGHAFALLGTGPGELFLLHVVPAERSVRDDTLLASQLREQLPRLAGRVAARTEIVHSDRVADAIVATARRLGADAICLSSHGRSGVRKAILGSVAEAVLREADRPVFVVRTPA